MVSVSSFQVPSTSAEATFSTWTCFQFTKSGKSAGMESRRDSFPRRISLGSRTPQREQPLFPRGVRRRTGEDLRGTRWLWEERRRVLLEGVREGVRDRLLQSLGRREQRRLRPRRRRDLLASEAPRLRPTRRVTVASRSSVSLFSISENVKTASPAESCYSDDDIPTMCSLPVLTPQSMGERVPSMPSLTSAPVLLPQPASSFSQSTNYFPGTVYLSFVC